MPAFFISAGVCGAVTVFMVCFALVFGSR
jgi:hypothetical protein